MAQSEAHYRAAAQGLEEQFQDNLADITASPAILAGALAGLGNDVSAEVLSRGAANMREMEMSLDQALAHQAIITNTERLMGALSGSSSGLTGLAAHYTREQQMRATHEREARARRDGATSILLLNNLRAFEANTAEIYGEDFAENLFADLHAQGAISDEDYQEAMAIEDPEARKRAIAARIQEGLDDGSIKPEELQGHPWAQEWLERHEAYNDARNAEAQAALNGKLSADELSRDASFIARDTVLQNAPNIRSAFETAAIGEEQTEQELEITQELAFNLSNQLGGVSF